jgi:uncharacterized protein YhaN
MRIDRLDLIAYGPFTDESLDLSAPGLHLVLGANEAGKSSTLAAVTDALFGIPLRTGAGFVHHMTRLEIGMTLRDEHGGTFAFRRLKKAKDSLRAPDGSVLDAEALAAFTAGVDRATFTTMFGITHDQLVAGGRDLLAGHGELGELLFGASTGSANLHRTLQELEDRCAVLFKAGGHNPRVNAGISRYKTAATKARDHALRPRAYDDVMARIRRLEGAVAETRAAIASHTAERSLVHLLIAVLPNLRGRASLRATLGELEPDTERLRPEIGAELVELQAGLDRSRGRQRAAAAEVQRLGTEIAALAVDDRVSDEAEAISALREQRGQYEQAVRDRSPVAAEAVEARRKAEQLVSRLRPGLRLDDARAALVLPEPIVAPLLALADAGADILGALDVATARADDAAHQEHAARDAIDAAGAVPDDRVLTTALAACRADGDLDDRRQQLEATLLEIERDAASDIAQLGLAGSDGVPSVHAVAALAVPPLATVHDHADAWAADARIATEQCEARDRLDEELRRDERDLARLIDRNVPTDDELRASREQRDAQWAALRASFVAPTGAPDTRDISTGIAAARTDPAAARTDPADPGTGRTEVPEVLDTFEALVASADGVADRLRSSAADVARRARLEQRIRDQRAQRAELADAAAAHAARTELATTAWRSLWRGITSDPAPPREMFAWLEAHARVVGHARRVTDLLDERDRVDARIARHRGELRAALAQVGVATPPDPWLPSLVALATATAADLARAQRERAQLLAEHARAAHASAEAARAVADTEQRHQRWRASWAEALARLDLDPDLSIASVRAFVRDAESAVDLIDAAVRAEARLDLIDRFVAGFVADVRAVAGRLGPESAHGDPVDVLRQLVERQARAEATAERVRTLHAELAQHERELAEARSHEAAGAAHLADLLAEVGVTSDAELRAAIQRSERCAEVERELDRIEHELQRQSAGQPAAALEAALAGRDELALAGRGAELDALLDDLRHVLERDTIELGQLQEQRSAMDGSAEAADAAAAGQMALAQVAQDAEEYLAVHLATLLLRDAIARYREQHQAPLLELARPWFARLTDGSFATLDTDLDAKGNTVLEAVRPDGERVVVSALSEGTRDQLFLALRLAAVSLAAARTEPMPLILDDLFVNFDEARTAAALEIFGELARTMQVVLFTHHRHVAELARSVLRADRVHLHQLTPRASGRAPDHVVGHPAGDRSDRDAPVRLRPVS